MPTFYFHTSCTAYRVIMLEAKTEEEAKKKYADRKWNDDNVILTDVTQEKLMGVTSKYTVGEQEGGY